MICLLLRKSVQLALIVSLLSAGYTLAQAKDTSISSLAVTVVDRSGTLLEHAVVSLHTDKSVMADPSETAIIDQRQMQFSPAVVAVQAGSSVSFPNQDNVRHHVYSFSHPNAFELKLYHGEKGNTQRFMHPGVVVLGCNIHDGMLGYLRVVDTPYFASTDVSGELLIENVEPGQYTMQIWHPDLGNQLMVKSVTIQPGRLGTRQVLDIANKEPVQLKAAHPLQSLFRD